MKGNVVSLKGHKEGRVFEMLEIVEAGARSKIYDGALGG
jgi:hypothetical protein